MQAPLLRARSPGEILDAAFQVMRAHYPALVLASGAFMLPPILLAWFFPALTPVASILDRLLSLAASAVVAVVVSDIYLGNGVDIGRSISAVGRRFGSVWGAALIQGFVILMGILLLVVPAFIFFAWGFAMPVIVMVEGVTASQSWDRSRALTKGFVGHVLATVGVAWIISFAVLIGRIMVLGAMIGVAGIDERIIEPLTSLAMALVFPFVGVVTTLLYYDLRIRKEGFDLQLLAESMGEEAPGEPALA